MSAYATLSDLRSQLGQPRDPSAVAAYAEKMLHPIPDAPVVNREAFVLDHCRGKRVLDFGASGRLHGLIRDAASACLGVDLQASEGVVAFDLDDVAQIRLPGIDFQPEVIVCAEVLEHLGNPRWFLERLLKWFPTVPLVITVPNTFSEIEARHIRSGIENVNRDHCWWPSYHTMKTLLRKSGYRAFFFGWYHGKPLTAEGLVILCEGAG